MAFFELTWHSTLPGRLLPELQRYKDTVVRCVALSTGVTGHNPPPLCDLSWFRHIRTTPSVVKLINKIAFMARPFDRKLRGHWIQRLPSERPVSSPQDLQPDPDHHQTPLEVVPFRSWPGWFVGNSFPCRPGLQVCLSQGLDSAGQISSSPRFVERKSCIALA